VGFDLSVFFFFLGSGSDWGNLSSVIKAWTVREILPQLPLFAYLLGWPSVYVCVCVSSKNCESRSPFTGRPMAVTVSSFRVIGGAKRSSSVCDERSQ